MFWSDFSEFGLTRDPWFNSALRGIRHLQDEVNRLFEGASPYAARGYPPVNVWSGPDELIVSAELPGIDSKELDLSVMGNVLTISGSRKETELNQDQRYLRRERGFGSFTRTVELPYVVNGENVEATYKDGLLKIVLRRAESDKPRRISIK